MLDSIAYLGPAGTYAEMAAIDYAAHINQPQPTLLPYPTIAQALQAVAANNAQLAVVPVENSIEGSVTFTLDTLWQLGQLQIQQALVLPITHGLLSYAEALEKIEVVYSHPQALAQCQDWLEKYLADASLIPTNSTTEAVQFLSNNPKAGAIASQRAAQLYHVPILGTAINDRPDNCTRFWVLSLQPSVKGSHTSLAFSFPANLPGALAKALQIFAARNINLSRIESRPTKRSLGEYLFFIDIEANICDDKVNSALAELKQCTETLKTFGSYTILPIDFSKI